MSEDNVDVVIEEIDVANDDSVLDYSQRQRKKLIDDLTRKGMPADKDSQQVLLTALAGMDKVAISKKRLKVEEGTKDAAQQGMELAMLVLKQIKGTNPHLAQPNQPNPNANGVKEPVLPAPDLVPGQTNIGHEIETYEEFSTRMEKQRTEGEGKE